MRHGRGRFGIGGRPGLLALACLVLVVTSATVPFVASSDGTEIESPIVHAATDAAEAPPHGPSGAEVAAILLEAHEKEEERTEWLASPEAVEERQNSLHAYAGLGTAEAEALLTEKFPEQLASLNADPARMLSDAHLDQPLGEGAAVVTEDGKAQLLEGNFPVEAKNKEGRLEKIDVGLEKTDEGFRPENPVVEVTIPNSPGEGVELGEEGSPRTDPAITVTQVGAESAEATRYGEKNVFYGEVEPGSDMDLLVSPTIFGVELSDVLRSVASPEIIRYRVEVPEGDQLQQGGTGARIVDPDGKTLYEIPEPIATDAQGTRVPTALSVEGEMIVLDVEHREMEVDYPVLVDPEVFENWNVGNLPGIGPWIPYESAPGNGISTGTQDEFFKYPNGQYEPGLYFATRGYLTGGAWTELAYQAPNYWTYISHAVLNTWVRKDEPGCRLLQEPYDYDGSYVYAESGNPVSGHWNTHNVNDAYWKGNSEIAGWGNEIVIGYGNDVPGIHGGEGEGSCWRNAADQGTQLWLEDWSSPSYTAQVPSETKWLPKNGETRAIQLDAIDQGLGVKNVRMFGVGTPNYWWNHPECAGTYENPCQTNESGEIHFTTDGFPREGEVGYEIQVESPTQRRWSNGEYHLRIDGEAPEIELGGELAKITDEEGLTENKEQGAGHDHLTLPVYNLTVTARDGSEASPRSGVKEVRLYVTNGGSPRELVAGKTASCTSESCPSTLSWNYPLNLTELGEGQHTLEVAAVDFVGNERRPEQRKINFQYYPATGMKEEYVLQHFLLPDGKNHEGEEYAGPELTVNVTDGNLAYHQRDLEVQAQSASLPVERFYNAQQPSSRNGQWGRGWSLAETPVLTPAAGEAVPKTGTMMRTSAITGAVQLPQSPTQATFDQRLHARITHTAGGGYKVAYPEDEASIFSPSGQIEEARLGNTVSPDKGAGGPPPPRSYDNVTYESPFGSQGSGAGMFQHPAGIAIAPSGDLWVADQWNKRIEEFSGTGTFIRSIGGSEAGFFRPTDVAVDGSGNIWVTDPGAPAIDEFNESGALMMSFAFDGQPEAIAADGDHIWVANARPGYWPSVVELNATGEVREAFGEHGTKPGQLLEAGGIAVGPGKKIWVTDRATDRVEEFAEGEGGEFIGEFIRQLGSSGSEPGQFRGPDAVTVDEDGDVWVVDQNNSRVQEFDEEGTYLGQFGESGAGAAQFDLSWPTGIVADSEDLWISDTEGDRVERWSIHDGGPTPTYQGTIAPPGEQEGHVLYPGGLTVDAEGDLWVADEFNNRVEEFGRDGEFISAFGGAGTPGPGGSTDAELQYPSAVAVDEAGDVWVVDGGEHCVEEYRHDGAYVMSFGSEGAGQGQLAVPQGIAVAEGDVWVADTGNHRLQEFDQRGELERIVAPAAGEPGHLVEPTEVAIGPEGNVWTTDRSKDRVVEYTAEGEFVEEFGGPSGDEFNRPTAVAVDRLGHVWVADGGSGRVEGFTASGDRIAQFGNHGTGPGGSSFEFPCGVAVDPDGRIDVSDFGSSRIEAWSAPEVGESGQEEPYNPAPSIDYEYSGGGTTLTAMALQQPATPAVEPTVALSTAEGLTRSASAGGLHKASYAYSAGTMIAATDSEGETRYTYDPTTHLLTKVELPNGTYASITYDAYSRVTAVLVHPVTGTARTVDFSYEAEDGSKPRRTVVFGGGVQETTYFIGEDGGVLRWELGATTPAIEAQSGGVWTARNSTTPIEQGKDETLFATAYSQNEIASIAVIANGNSLVEEEPCTDLGSPPTHVCDYDRLKWVMNPAEFQPGRLNLEVIATDFNGHQFAENFFITIPEPPAPNPEAPELPIFRNIVDFREEFGLDRHHPLTKAEETELCLELLYEFEAGRPAAVKATEMWGVPMREPEILEMEERERWVNQAAQVLPEWAEEHAASTYGGFYVDERAGSKIYVGFTSNQSADVEALENSGLLVAPTAEIAPFPTPPTQTVTSLEASEDNVIAAIEGDAGAFAATTGVEFNPESNKVEVASTNPALVQEFVNSRFGSGAPVRVYGEPEPPSLAWEGRFKAEGPVAGGQAIFGKEDNGEEGACTSGFSAYAPGGELRGQPVDKHFVLTAGHCFALHSEVSRRAYSLEGQEVDFGDVRRRSWVDAGVEEPQTDAEGIFLPDESKRSHGVFNGNPNSLVPMYGVARPKIGMRVCWSGFLGGYDCGHIIRRRWFTHVEDSPGKRVWDAIVAGGQAVKGDSGGPVWNPETQEELGIITLLTPEPGKPCHKMTIRGIHTTACPRMGFTPLLPFRGKAHPEGIMEKLGVSMVLK